MAIVEGIQDAIRLMPESTRTITISDVESPIKISGEKLKIEVEERERIKKVKKNKYAKGYFGESNYKG
jgi:hypothetical protein